MLCVLYFFFICTAYRSGLLPPTGRLLLLHLNIYCNIFCWCFYFGSLCFCCCFFFPGLVVAQLWPILISGSISGQGSHFLVARMFFQFLWYLSCWTFHACASISSLSCVFCLLLPGVFLVIFCFVVYHSLEGSSAFRSPFCYILLCSVV